MIALISERPSTSHRTGRSSRIRAFAVSTNRSTMSPSNRMGFRSMRLRSAPIWLPTVRAPFEHLVGEAGDQVLGGVHAHVRVATVPIDVASDRIPHLQAMIVFDLMLNLLAAAH